MKKNLLIVLISIFFNFQSFGACNYGTLSNIQKEEISQKFKEILKKEFSSFFNSYQIEILKQKIIINLGTIFNNGYLDIPQITFYFLGKTSNGNFLSTRISDQNFDQELNQEAISLDISSVVRRDPEGTPLKEVCYISTHYHSISIYNLTINNYLVGTFNLKPQPIMDFDLPKN